LSYVFAEKQWLVMQTSHISLPRHVNRLGNRGFPSERWRLMIVSPIEHFYSNPNGRVLN